MIPSPRSPAAAARSWRRRPSGSQSCLCRTTRRRRSRRIRSSASHLAAGACGCRRRPTRLRLPLRPRQRREGIPAADLWAARRGRPARMALGELAAETASVRPGGARPEARRAGGGRPPRVKRPATPPGRFCRTRWWSPARTAPSRQARPTGRRCAGATSQSGRTPISPARAMPTRRPPRSAVRQIGLHPGAARRLHRHGDTAGSR